MVTFFVTERSYHVTLCSRVGADGPRVTARTKGEKMTVRKTRTATDKRRHVNAEAAGYVPDAAAAADSAVLNGVTGEPANAAATPPRRRRAASGGTSPAPATAEPATPAKTTARKTPATAKTPAPAKAPANGKAPASAKAEPGYRAYATKEIPSAMTGFAAWISREFKDIFPDGVDPRLVTIASKAYRYYQSSDLNR